MDRSRLEAFSDGVFAVAITLLALDLTVEGPGHGALLEQLTRKWPAFLAYLISFFMIGIIWVNHHALVRSITKVDRLLLFLNLVLLLFVVLIPFTTSTEAAYFPHNNNDARLAMALYDQSKDLIELGAYVPGSNPQLDASIRAQPEFIGFLRQRVEGKASQQQTMDELIRLSSIVN